MESLTTEAIRMYGHDVLYIPRETVSEDFIFGDEVSEFTDANSIEMYFENVGGFDGDSEMATRFGLDVKDNAVFVVSKKRFLDVMGHNADIQKKGRPREGDLIFFDVPRLLMEVKFVEHENPFYPLGEQYSFKLSCEAFKSAGEKVVTGDTDVDDPISLTSTYLIGITLGAGSGTYTLGEEVYTGSLSDKVAYGKVNAYTVPAVGDKSVKIHAESGTFTAGSTLVGSSSGASYAISGVYNTTIVASNIQQQDNEDLELEQKTTDIFDFTEQDPFSEGGY